ncbi:MAG: hypothetical protein WCG27_04830, partial [Pseudomonadota bacterium]
MKTSTLYLLAVMALPLWLSILVNFKALGAQNLDIDIDKEQLWAKEEDFVSFPIPPYSEWDNLTIQETESKLLEIKITGQRQYKENLLVAKNYLIGGDLYRAALYLDKIKGKTTFYALIRDHYLAIIY